MSETVPNGGDAGGAARLLASARERLSVALADLALPARLRLTEWQRTIVARLLAGLVRSIEDELRADLAGRFGGEGEEAAEAALTSHVAIAAPILEASRAPWDAALIGALLRRAEEHRLHKAAAGDNALLIELAGAGSDDIAGEAMALLVAQGARLDRFQEPVMARNELDAELQHGLVWSVAAALRRYLTERQRIDPARADSAIAASAGRILAGHDEGRRVEAMALRLVRMLDQAGRLDDAFMLRALTEGSLPLFLAALAVRTGLDPDAAWEIVSAPDGVGPALLLRSAGVGRGEAGAILLTLDEDGAEGQLDRFDAVGEAEAGAALGLWQADPGYRQAIARLAQ